MTKGRLKIFLVGGDGEGWALDTDLRLAREAFALCRSIEVVDDLAKADIVHTVWPEELVENPKYFGVWNSKPVVAVFSNDPVALVERVPHFFHAAQHWSCVAQSSDCATKLRQLGISPKSTIPYIADLVSFQNDLMTQTQKLTLRQELKIPDGAFVISNFQRDSSGADLNTIKAQKGADLLAAIALGLKKRGGSTPFHFLLGGPRRHWIRNTFDDLGVSYTYVGKRIDGEDYPDNILPAKEIAKLLSVSDINLITSRWEGGPRAALESIACGTPVFSTPVGLTIDLLPPQWIYRNLSEAVDIISAESKKTRASTLITGAMERLKATHATSEVARHWNDFYSNFDSATPPSWSVGGVPQTAFHPPSPLTLASRRIAKKLRQNIPVLNRRRTITIWGELVKGPYGGGSQFLKALAKELGRRGFKIENNSYARSDGHIMNSTFFDLDKARTVFESKPIEIQALHRIDGPISIYRGTDRHLDEQIFGFNREVATATVFQSLYSWRESVRLGFKPVRPCIVRNACDPSLFNRKPNVPVSEKMKVISTSWSTNPRKGFSVYQELEDLLDFRRFDFSYIGRRPENGFKHIKMFDAMDSERLGAALKQADVYLTASLFESASNALLEGIVTGLPVVYANSGGSSEFVWFAGLPFDNASEIPKLLETIRKDYESYRLVTYAQSIAEVADNYLKLLNLA